MHVLLASASHVLLHTLLLLGGLGGAGGGHFSAWGRGGAEGEGVLDNGCRGLGGGEAVSWGKVVIGCTG